MSLVGIPCNPCSNGICGNCVAVKLESVGFINRAKDHCSCANNGHTNKITKDLPHKNPFGSKKDTETTPSKEVSEDDVEE